MRLLERLVERQVKRQGVTMVIFSPGPHVTGVEAGWRDKWRDECAMVGFCVGPYETGGGLVERQGAPVIFSPG